MPLWDRVDAMPIPVPLTVDRLRTLNDDEFGLLIRSNLMPRDPARRKQWDALWRTLTEWPDLQQRASTLLDQWIDQTDCGGYIDGAADSKRREQFANRCEDALNRLDPPKAIHHGATRSEKLLSAIAAHRAVILDSAQHPRPADVALWAWLDPGRRHERARR